MAIAAESPTTDEKTSLAKVAWRAFGTFRTHQMTDHAATLVYFAMQSLFPGILVGLSLLGLLGEQSIAHNAADYVVRHGADRTTGKTVQDALDNLFKASSGGVGIALAISVLLGLNGASGAFAASGRALNVVYAVDEDRGFVRRKLTDVGSTLVVLLLLLVVLVSLFLGGGIAHDLFGTIGLGDTGASIWAIARWPVALVGAMAAFSWIYAFAPDVAPRRLKWISTGAVVAVVIWIAASIGFGIYVKNFSSYGAAYGAAGAVIILLLWLYITANAFLFGAELNAALEREETAGRGGPPFLTPPPRAAGGDAPPGTAPRPARDPDPLQSSGGPGELSSG